MVTKFEDQGLRVYRGDTETFRFTVTENGSPKDLSGYAILAQGRADVAETTVIFEKQIADNVGGTDLGNGIIVLELTATDTQTFEDTLVYDIQATSGNTVTTLVRGTIRVTRDVTRN